MTHVEATESRPEVLTRYYWPYCHLPWRDARRISGPIMGDYTRAYCVYNILCNVTHPHRCQWLVLHPSRWRLYFSPDLVHNAVKPAGLYAKENMQTAPNTATTITTTIVTWTGGNASGYSYYLPLQHWTRSNIHSTEMTSLYDEVAEDARWMGLYFELT